MTGNRLAWALDRVLEAAVLPDVIFNALDEHAVAHFTTPDEHGEWEEKLHWGLWHFATKGQLEELFAVGALSQRLAEMILEHVEKYSEVFEICRHHRLFD